MFRLRNMLYGNDCVCAFEIVHGRLPNLLSNDLIKLLPDLFQTHESSRRRRKLKLVLKSQSITEDAIKVGYILELFIKKPNDKRGKWVTNKSVLLFDPSELTITFAGRNGHTANAALEDVRLSLQHHSLAKEIQDAIMLLNDDIDWLLSTDVPPMDTTFEDDSRTCETPPIVVGDNEDSDVTFVTNEEKADQTLMGYDLFDDPVVSTTQEMPIVDDRVNVY